MIVNRKLSRYDNTSTILDVYREDKDFKAPYSTVNTGTQTYSNIFQQNIIIARVDHDLKVDTKVLKDLLIIKDSLERIESKEYYIPFLKEKCGFLIFKIYYRYQQKKENYLYAIDFIDKDINLEDIKTPHFNFFRKITETHYLDTNNNVLDSITQKRISEFQKKRERGGVGINFCDYHAIIKYYKDDQRNPERLKNLKDEFYLFYDKRIGNQNLFNKRAYEIAKNYIVNNLFSLMLEQKNCSIDDWKESLRLIETMQDDLKIKNYFPYYKSILFLEKKIDDQFKNSGLNFDLLNSLINQLKSALFTLNKKIAWCSERSFLAFQLPFEECIVNVEAVEKGQEINGFLSSSFVLPIDYNELSSFVQDANSNLLKYRTMYDVQLNFNKDKEEIKELRKKMENTDKRNIEILSIFSAIVLFVAGDIQLFTKISDSNSAITFMIFFGYILGSFVLLIWFITRSESVNLKTLPRLHLFIIVLFIGGALFGVALLKGEINLRNESTKNIDSRNDLNYTIDTLEKRVQIIKLRNELK